MLDRRLIINKTEVSVNKLTLLSPEVIINKSFNFSLFYQLYNVKELSDNNLLKIYHLNYFDYIHDFESEKGIELIIKWINDNKDFSHISWDRYPISVRIVNWIKFLTKYNIENHKIYK